MRPQLTRETHQATNQKEMPRYIDTITDFMSILFSTITENATGKDTIMFLVQHFNDYPSVKNEKRSYYGETGNCRSLTVYVILKHRARLFELLTGIVTLTLGIKQRKAAFFCYRAGRMKDISVREKNLITVLSEYRGTGYSVIIIHFKMTSLFTKRGE